MKIPSATATAIAAVILLCAFSTGGQQQQTDKGKQQTPGFTPIAPKRKTPAKPSDWRMPDGRVVEFPASTSKEEIDALAKRIAEGAVELPPGARVVGWEPVEGADSLLPAYEQRVATIPTMKGKLDALANAAGILQAQVNLLRELEKLDSKYANDLSLHYAGVLNDHAARINQALAVAADADTEIRAQSLFGDARHLKQELDDFKDAACPILRRAEVGWATKLKIDSACGLH